MPGEMISAEHLVSELKEVTAFPQAEGRDVVIQETHISWIFLVGDWAYKIKKPVRNAFLDYRSLADRRHYCEEEFRLDRRFAPDLYLGVVPITREGDQLKVEGNGQPIEYAVKMRRFPPDALLHCQLRAGAVGVEDIEQLAEAIAQAHSEVQTCHPRIGETLHHTLRDAVDNLCELQPQVTGETAEILRQLQTWTRDTFEAYEGQFAARVAGGFIRECHGDLHCGNIVRWQGRWLPFDGVEFNDDFRLIDVLNDAAFLAMDLAAHEREDLANIFINSYLERTADRSSLALLRWYMVYRAMVRAKVAALRAEQLQASHSDCNSAISERDKLIRLAQQLARGHRPSLAIMHGVSGSGKTTISTQLVAKQGAIRLRSDVERKRLFELDPTTHPDAKEAEELYADTATKLTYAQLISIAEEILAAGYGVILDATFLRQVHRQTAHELAERMGVEFAIIDCATDFETLRQRLSDRAGDRRNASDADLSVLESQLAKREPLTDIEQPFVVHWPPGADPSSPAL